jgi:hypothetical protein
MAPELTATEPATVGPAGEPSAPPALSTLLLRIVMRRAGVDPWIATAAAAAAFVLLTRMGVRLRVDSHLTRSAVSFTPLSGQRLDIELDALHLRFEPVAPATTFRICS